MKNIDSTPQAPVEPRKSTNNRRNFLKKSAIGATIASIPAHSVWAGRLISGNMSGNVSGWAEESELMIKSHGFYKNHSGYGEDIKFITAFGHSPFPNGTMTMPSDLTLLDVMNNYKINGDDNNKTGGPGNVNMQLAAMYLNAKNSPSFTYWPVIDPTNGPFRTLDDYADYLYEQASENPSNVGGQLDLIIKKYDF